eukprot:5964205-Amphidinium_carterae.1
MTNPEALSMLLLEESGTKKERIARLLLEIFACPHWNKERCQLPADNETVPACVKYHGFLPAPRQPAILTNRPWFTGLMLAPFGLLDQANTAVTRIWRPMPGIKQAASSRVRTKSVLLWSGKKLARILDKDFGPLATVNENGEAVIDLEATMLTCPY